MPWRKVLKGILVLLLVLLMIMPVGALYYISAQEQAQYDKSEEPFALEALSYGDPMPVYRTDLRETIRLSGCVVSTDVVYEELEMENPSELRLLVSVGEPLEAGDLIGYYNGDEVLATKTGIIRSISLSCDAYIELWSLDALAIECYVTDTQLNVLQRSGLELTDIQGNAYAVVHIDSIRVGSDLTRVLLASETVALTYGKPVDAMTLYTGRVYTGSLVVDSRCVFTTDGGETYYVRLVNSDGTIIGDAQVEVGFTMGDVTSIAGVEEGQYCDSGYKAIVER